MTIAPTNVAHVLMAFCLHQAVFSRIMGAATDRGDAHTASVKVARR
jgi:hypothetical protein